MEFFTYLFLFLTFLIITLITKKIIHKKSKESNSSTITFIINNNLNMSTGKIISQLAHAMTNVSSFMLLNKEVYKNWEVDKKVVIYKADLLDMEEIASKAHNKEIRYAKIHDAGRTQIPSGSNTVLIIGPMDFIKYKHWFNNLNKLV